MAMISTKMTPNASSIVPELHLSMSCSMGSSLCSMGSSLFSISFHGWEYSPAHSWIGSKTGTIVSGTVSTILVQYTDDTHCHNNRHTSIRNTYSNTAIALLLRLTTCPSNDPWMTCSWLGNDGLSRGECQSMAVRGRAMMACAVGIAQSMFQSQIWYVHFSTVSDPFIFLKYSISAIVSHGRSLCVYGVMWPFEGLSVSWANVGVFVVVSSDRCSINSMIDCDFRIHSKWEISRISIKNAKMHVKMTDLWIDSDGSGLFNSIDCGCRECLLHTLVPWWWLKRFWLDFYIFSLSIISKYYVYILTQTIYRNWHKGLNSFFSCIPTKV